MAGDAFFPGLANFAERGLNALGHDPAAFPYEHDQMAASTARIQAATDAIMEDLRRQQADDAARAMVEQRLGLPPGGFQAGMFQASLEQAQLGTKVEMTQLGILQDQLKKAQEDPIDFVMSQIYHKLADKGVLMDDPDELRQYATTQSKINNAVQAQAYQKDQAIEQLLSASAATTGLPATLAAKKSVAATFDSLTQKFNVPPDQAMSMLGQSLTAQSLGMPGPSPLPVSPDYLSAVGEKVGRNAASPEQIATISRYLREATAQAGESFILGDPQGKLKEIRATLAKYGVKSEADLKRLSRDKADRFIRSVIGGEQPGGSNNLLWPGSWGDFSAISGWFKAPPPPTIGEAFR